MAKRTKAKINTGEALSNPVYHEFIREVLEHPERAEDVGRILTDWLEEHDESDLADLAPPPVGRYLTSRDEGSRCGPRRVRVMLPGWPRAVLRDLNISPFDAGTLASGLSPEGELPDLIRYLDSRNVPEPIAVVRYGFLTEVACPLEIWNAHGHDLLRRQPVRTMRTSAPLRRCSSGAAVWTSNEAGDVFHQLRGESEALVWGSVRVLTYISHTDAHAAHSAARLNRDRAALGLEPLPYKDWAYNMESRRQLWAWLAAVERRGGRHWPLDRYVNLAHVRLEGSTTLVIYAADGIRSNPQREEVFQATWREVCTGGECAFRYSE